MSAPVCPDGYECIFTPQGPPPHYYAHWYDGPWGIVATIIALVAIAFILCYFAYYVAQVREARQRRIGADHQREFDERREAADREHRLAMSEQLTMQLDAAKGNTEMLKLIRDTTGR